MPLLSQHQSNEYTKLILMGDPGSGKTGALTSLVKAGYKLRILDYDNGLETLKQFVYEECPENVENVEFRTLQDRRRSSPSGPIIDGAARAYADGVSLLGHWKYTLDGQDVDLGVPARWGSDTILVLDTLTRCSDAAFDWAEQLLMGTKSGKYDQRMVYYNAQDAIEKLLALLNGVSFQTNVIVLAHIKYQDNPNGTRKGYPVSVGAALSPVIGSYFNTMLLCQTKMGGRRTIQTVADPMIDLKNPKPFAIEGTYDISTGLADIFQILREQPQVKRRI